LVQFFAESCTVNEMHHNRLVTVTRHVRKHIKPCTLSIFLRRFRWNSVRKIKLPLWNSQYRENRSTVNHMSITVQQDATIYSLLYFCKLLYMFWVVTPPIIRSTYYCNYSIWHSSNSLCYFPLLWSWSWWWVELPPETCREVYRNI